jgi:hypothetical protein
LPTRQDNNAERRDRIDQMLENARENQAAPPFEAATQHLTAAVAVAKDVERRLSQTPRRSPVKPTRGGRRATDS